MIKISDVVKELKPSGIREFFDLVLGMDDVISLGVGEPDFITPWSISEFAIESIEKGYTSYTSNKGLIELRKNISLYLKKKYSFSYDPDTEILITVGASEGTDIAIRTLIRPGDKVLIPIPTYVSYEPMTILAGGIPVLIKTDPKKGFKLNPKDIEKYSDSNTKALILNYPSNPTGVSYSKSELKKINEICLKNNIVVISDEIYGDLTYDFNHIPFPTLPGAKKNTIYLNGFSKSYAMTGWRVGYACGPKEVIDGMTKIHQYTIMCVPIMSQMAALEAIKNGEDDVRSMKMEYDRRRRFIWSSLNKIGLKSHLPEGAFYLFPSIKTTGLDSMTFAKKLLKEERIALIPGTAFNQEGYVRISYASSMDNLKESVIRIERFLKKLKK